MQTTQNSILDTRFSINPKVWVGFILISISLAITFTLFLPHPAVLIIAVLWISALISILLPVRIQLILLWIFVPFIDFFKRLVYLDPNATTQHTYLVLLTPEILLITILCKLLITGYQGKIKFHINKADLFVILFGGYSAFSALTTANAPVTARLATVVMWVWPMVAYFLYAIYFTEDKWMKVLFNATVVIGLLVALYGIRQFFFGFFPFENTWFMRAENSNDIASLQAYYVTRGVLRTFGPMDSHSSFGLFMGTALILVWPGMPRRGRFVSLLVSIVLLLGLILSFTRFTWAMPIFAVSFIVLFNYSKIRPFLNLKKLRRASLLMLGLIGSAFAFYFLMEVLYGHNFIATTNPYLLRAFGTGTLEARLRFGYLIENRAFFNPIGTGLTNSGYWASKFGFVSNDIDYHSQILEILGAMGMIGLILFFLLLIYFFNVTLSNLKAEENPITKRYLIALFSLILAFYVVGHFNGAVYYYGSAMPIYFWGISGILVHHRANQIHNQDRSNQPEGTSNRENLSGDKV